MSTTLTTRTWAAVRAEAVDVQHAAFAAVADHIHHGIPRPCITEEDAQELLRMLKAVTLFLNTPAEPASPSGVPQ